jgi:hypothetical protein
MGLEESVFEEFFDLLSTADGITDGLLTTLRSELSAEKLPKAEQLAEHFANLTGEATA